MDLKVKLTLTEELLGTASANPEIHAEFIASQAPNAQNRAEEVEAIPALSTTTTVFPKENDKPFLWDYQIKCFFKDACNMLTRVDDTKSSEIKAYKKVIDGLVFVTPRKLFLNLPANKTLGKCQRPLRGQTAQGERIALTSSETAPEGTTIDLTITCLSEAHIPLVKEWLDYGKLRGIGQWRNSGKGRFTWATA
jgi:hypothetical protein